jgi:hypothetical protein
MKRPVYLSPITSCMLRCLLHHYQGDHCVIYSRTILFLQRCYVGCAIKYKSYPVFLMYSPQCHHMSLIDFVGPRPGCGRSVTDFWGWDAHEAQLRCPDEVDGDIWIWSTRRDRNLSSTKLPRPWLTWESSPSRKNPMAEPGIEPGTSQSVVRNSNQ